MFIIFVTSFTKNVVEFRLAALARHSFGLQK